MNRIILLLMTTGLLAVASERATADVVLDEGFGPRALEGRFLTVDHRRYSEPRLGFYYRDRDGFYFGYDPWNGRRWYRDQIRQRYYERYYDHHKRRWHHRARDYRDYRNRHYRHHRHHYDRGRWQDRHGHDDKDRRHHDRRRRN